MDVTPESPLAVCEFEGCSVPLSQGDPHCFCLCHAACWVGDTFDPESCECCCLLVTQFTQSSDDSIRVQAARALQSRFRLLQRARLVASPDAPGLPRFAFRDPDLGVGVASILVQSAPPRPSPSVRSGPPPLLPAPKRLRVSGSEQGLLDLETRAASGVAPSGGAAEAFESCLPAEASGSDQWAPLPPAFPAAPSLSCGVGAWGEDSASGPVVTDLEAGEGLTWGPWAPLDPAWVFLPTERGLLLQGVGFSFPPSAYELDLVSAPPRVRFRVPPGTSVPSFRRFSAYRIQPGVVRAAFAAYLLRDPDYASEMDPSTFRFGTSFPFWLRYEVPESSWLADCPLFGLDSWHSFCRSRTLEWREASTVLQVFLGGELEYLNECLFAPALPRDVGVIQLHVQVPSLSAALVAEDLRARGLLCSALRFFSLLELSSDWLVEDVGTLGSVPGSGTLSSAARSSAALLKLFTPILRDAVSLFYASRLACRQAVLGSSVESAWALALRRSSPFCPLLFGESAVAQFIQAASAACRPMSDLLVFRGSRGGSSRKGRARARGSSRRGRPLVSGLGLAPPADPPSSGRRGVRAVRGSGSRKGRRPFRGLPL